jgi:hypothetical protein
MHIDLLDHPAIDIQDVELLSSSKLPRLNSYSALMVFGDGPCGVVISLESAILGYRYYVVCQ